MPYIKQERRDELLKGIKIVPEVLWEESHAWNAGELNFLLTHVVNKYMKVNGLDYRKLNDVIGALEACKLEFYRRTVAPYEDKKILENGDVY